jgi:hypothetical protein
MLLPILRRTGVNAAGLPRRLRHFVALLLRLAGRGKVAYPKTIAGLSANDNVGAWLPILWRLRAPTFHQRHLTQQRPACLHQWTSTQCLSCNGWSPHSDWYSQ